MKPVRKLLCGIFFVIALLSALAVWGAYIAVWHDWQGVLGALIGLLTTPGAVIFPFVYWVVEGSFPTAYFATWITSIVAWFFAMTLLNES